MIEKKNEKTNRKISWTNGLKEKLGTVLSMLKTPKTVASNNSEVGN
jgi:hypothetical protein